MKRLFAGMLLLFFAVPVFAADDVASAVAGTVRKVDSTTKTFVLETDKGAKHTFHYTEDVSIHGAKDVAKTPDETFEGLKDGSKVAVHYTVKGSEETAHEVDIIGGDSFRATKGTVTDIDRGSKVIAIKTADGTTETFHLTDRAAVDSGKAIAKGSVKTAKVTVYYTEDAGEKIAHFFE
jgi:hypothetical protein